MEKEELISTLKTKVGNTNLSERSFSEYADNIFPEDANTIDDAFIERHANILKSITGQMRADVSTALAKALPDEVKRYLEKNSDFIKNYIKAHPLDQPAPPTGETNEQLVQLLDKINKMQERIDAKDKEQTLNALRSAATKKIDESGIAVNKGIWDDAIKEITIADGATADDVFTLAKAKYEEKCKKYSFDGGKPNTGGGGTGNEKDPIITKYFERKFKKKS